jgi:hypothetical protein
MSVIIYKSKNYKKNGVPTQITHKIYPTGVIVTTEKDEFSFLLTKRYKKKGGTWRKAKVKRKKKKR